MGSLNLHHKLPEREALVFPDSDPLDNLRHQFEVTAEQFTIAGLRLELLERERLLKCENAILDASIQVVTSVDTPKPVTPKIADYGE